MNNFFCSFNHFIVELGDQNFLVAKLKEKIKVIGHKVFWALFENFQLFDQQQFDLPIDLVIEIFVIAKNVFGLYPKKLIHFQLLK